MENSPSSPKDRIELIPALRTAIDALPKAENHLHIEGSISLDEYRQVVQVPADWSPEAWARDYRYPSFADFEAFVLGYASGLFNSPERYFQSARGLFERKLAENLRYVECSFAAILSQYGKLPLDEVVDAIAQAVPAGLEVRIFMGLHHDGWIPETAPSLEHALTLDALDGIDLHGPEAYPVRDWLMEYWSAARAAGKATKAHAGELGGAWHVKEAVEKLGVRRVEHGFRAAEDPGLVERLRELEVVLDVCPISNYKLKTVPSFKAHPLLELHRAGIKCTLNTDDPFVFGNTLADDYEVVVTEMGFTITEMVSLARHAFEEALVKEETRQEWLQEFDHAAATLSDFDESL